MNNWASNKSVCFFLVAILFSSSRILFAGPEPLATDDKDYSKEVQLVKKSWCETPPLWEVRIGFPAWLAGVSGESGVKGVVYHVDVSFDQLLNHLTHFPIALSINARYQRWEFWVDGQYIEVGTSATLPGLLFTDANVHIKNALAEGFVGYRLINCDNANLTLFAGTRWTYLWGNLSIFDNGDARLVRLRELLGIQKRLDFSDSIDWVDPVVGLRLRHQFSPNQEIWMRGDVGGFGFQSNFQWQAVGVYSYAWQFTGYQLAALVGYRALGVNYTNTGNNNSVGLVLHGPIIGFSVRF